MIRLVSSSPYMSRASCCAKDPQPRDCRRNPVYFEHLATNSRAGVGFSEKWGQPLVPVDLASHGTVWRQAFLVGATCSPRFRGAV
jgi:hypothetical protein